MAIDNTLANRGSEIRSTAMSSSYGALFAYVKNNLAVSRSASGFYLCAPVEADETHVNLLAIPADQM